jgi:hypothetical protein
MIRNDFSDSIALTGTWEFSLGNVSPQGTIQVPGCWEAQGHSKFLEGPGHYQCKVHVPKNWAGHKILGEFEAVSYACEIHLNGILVGEHRGLWTPFLIDLTSITLPGEDNTLELIVYKPGERFPMRSTLAGFLPDVATTFGGIWQPVRLRSLKVGIDDVQIDTDFDKGGMQISCQARTYDYPLTDGRWEIIVSAGEKKVASQSLTFTSNGKLDTYLNIEDPILWSPTHPHLYTIQITLLENVTPVAQVSERIGLRRMTTNGDQLLFNDQPFMVRGILSWGWEPDRIAPAYTPEQAREEMRRVRQLGFNLIKLCLFVPNQAYYDIADEEGMLLWQEWPMWLPEITPELREIIKDEYSAMTGLTRHHPSVVLYSLGCELSQVVDDELLEDLNDTVRNLVSDVLVCDNSGSGESYGGLDYDFSDFTDYHPYCDIHYFEALLDNWRRDWQSPRPWIFGEFCDSDTFRDIGEIIDKNGGQRPWWMTSDNPVTTWRPESLALIEEEDRLERVQPGYKPQELVTISHAQSLVERKYTLESVRRRRGVGGYIVTGLRDTPISTSGIWDDLYRPKWETTEFLRINNEAVLTLDVTRKRRWHNGGDRPDRLDVFNHLSGSTVRWKVVLYFTGTQHYKGSTLSWSLADTNGIEIQAGGNEITHEITPGVPQELGIITCNLPIVEKGTEIRLDISLHDNLSAITNRWPIWVYPNPSDPPANLGIFDPAQLLDDHGEWLDGIARVPSAEELPAYGMLLTTVLDEELLRYVDNGGKLLLLQQGDGPLPSRRCPFWRESIILFSEHPLWESFPQHGYADMQFFGMASDLAFDSYQLLKNLPNLKDLRPILRRLDAREFHMSEYLFEAKVGKGILSGCSLRIQGGAGVQPYGWRRNIAGSALLWMLLGYMSSI